MTAFLSTALLVMMAFCIDIGYVVAVKSELQNAADAAALAGAQQLQTYFVQYYMPGQTQQQTIYNNATTDTTTATAPIPTAIQFAGYNQAGNVYLSLPSSDVTFSYYDGTTFSSASYPDNFPNTVNVTVRRDSTANGSLGLFFAQVLGINNLDLNATASATIYAGDVSSLQAIPGVSAHILPVALDVNVWMNFMQGNFSSPWLTGLTSAGPNNAQQLQVYPSGTNTPGNFGLLDLGPPANNAPAFRQWIDSGATPNDITYLLSNTMLPVSPEAPQAWKGGPGLTSTLIAYFQQEIGVANRPERHLCHHRLRGGDHHLGQRQWQRQPEHLRSARWYRGPDRDAYQHLASPGHETDLVRHLADDIRLCQVDALTGCVCAAKGLS
jgi:Flp pilus assembly protein TadG